MVTLSQVKRKLERYKVDQADFTLANFVAYEARKEAAEGDGTPMPYDSRFEEDFGLARLLGSSRQPGGREEDEFLATTPRKTRNTKLRGDTND